MGNATRTNGRCVMTAQCSRAQPPAHLSTACRWTPGHQAILPRAVGRSEIREVGASSNLMFFEGEGFASFAKVKKDKGGGDPISDGPDTKTTFYNKVGVFVRKKRSAVAVVLIKRNL